MKYLQKSFSFFLSEAGVSQAEWDAIFGKKDRRPASEEPAPEKERAGGEGREPSSRNPSSR